jgi:hypothetical protein
MMRRGPGARRACEDARNDGRPATHEALLDAISGAEGDGRLVLAFRKAITGRTGKRQKGSAVLSSVCSGRASRLDLGVGSSPTLPRGWSPRPSALSYVRRRNGLARTRSVGAAGSGFAVAGTAAFLAALRAASRASCAAQIPRPRIDRLGRPAIKVDAFRPPPFSSGEAR